MRFCTTEEKPVDIEIVTGGETHHISFYPTDLAVRERFYQVYENLKNYKPKEITPVVDENGVSNAELENARELRRFTEFLGKQVDGIYGEGTAKLLTGGRCEPTELIRFICETAHYFTQTSDKLIRHYTEAIKGGVME
ncbi:MAG: hypothetical protein MR291_08480 [Oscillospiraceae bacterium]|nr:hypothetical protein [Oscillospiraceae bacterium]